MATDPTLKSPDLTRSQWQIIYGALLIAQAASKRAYTKHQKDGKTAVAQIMLQDQLEIEKIMPLIAQIKI